ncbi:MAG: putative O-glycosylation ligase, exosortase A system-associated [Desulfuromonadales bacterium]|nr:putative O-glycosylation ligase, exosortase A system-associated [Desulfuromonadales bacterium]
MRDLIVTALIFGSLPFILRTPVIGILVWCWLGFMNPHRLCWGFSTSFPFAQVVAITTFISLLNFKEPKKIPWTRETKVLLLFIIWMFVTTCFALKSSYAWAQWDKVWKIQLMIFVTIMIMGTRDRVNALIWVTALSLGFYGIKGGLFTIMTGGNHMVLGPSNTFIGVRGGIALALNMTIPLMRYLQMNTNKAWVRHGLTVAMVLTLFAIIGTQSRGGFLGALAMGVFLLLKSRNKVGYAIVAIVAAVMVTSFMPPEWAERMHTLQTYQQDGSAMGRINAWGFAWNLAKDRPLFGGGFECFTADLFGQYAPNPWDVHDAHNIFFEVLGEHGFVGLFLFVMLFIFAWRTGSWIIRSARDDPETRWMADLASMIQVSLVAYCAGGFFLGLAYFDYYYHLIAILVLCKVMLEKQKAEQEADLKTAAENSFKKMEVSKPSVT